MKSDFIELWKEKYCKHISDIVDLDRYNFRLNDCSLVAENKDHGLIIDVKMILEEYNWILFERI